MPRVIKSIDLKLSILAPCIIASLITLSFYRSTMQISHGTRPYNNNYIVDDYEAHQLRGNGPGGCGISIGIITGIAGLALGGVTVGFGTAIAFSIGIHASAVLCAA